MGLSINKALEVLFRSHHLVTDWYVHSHSPLLHYRTTKGWWRLVTFWARKYSNFHFQRVPGVGDSHHRDYCYWSLLSIHKSVEALTSLSFLDPDSRFRVFSQRRKSATEVFTTLIRVPTTFHNGPRICSAVHPQKFFVKHRHNTLPSHSFRSSFTVILSMLMISH